MGYRRPRRVLHLVFAEPSTYAGLEVKVQALTIGEYNAWLALAWDDSPIDSQERVLAERLVGWNVETDGGEPVPATFDGLMSREPDEIRAIKKAWMQAMTSIPDGDPLALSSTSGLEAVLALPTEAPAELPAST